MSTHSTSISWFSPPEDLVLNDNEVHVWRARLAQAPATVRALSGLLTSNEMQRADGFRFSLDRERFLIGRGILRDILSRYLKLAPELIGFTYDRYGKPALEGNDDGLRFNV